MWRMNYCIYDNIPPAPTFRIKCIIFFVDMYEKNEEKLCWIVKYIHLKKTHRLHWIDCKTGGSIYVHIRPARIRKKYIQT